MAKAGAVLRAERALTSASALGAFTFSAGGRWEDERVTSSRRRGTHQKAPAGLTGSEPVILHEQPDRGRTIIEKFQYHAADAGCAVDINGVLYIPLDGGGRWRNAVSRELKAANVAVNLDALLN